MLLIALLRLFFVVRLPSIHCLVALVSAPDFRSSALPLRFRLHTLVCDRDIYPFPFPFRNARSPNRLPRWLTLETTIASISLSASFHDVLKLGIALAFPFFPKLIDEFDWKRVSQNDETIFLCFPLCRFRWSRLNLGCCKKSGT